MNPIFRYGPGDKLPEERPLGSGRYYARFSQTDTAPAPVAGGVKSSLLFEAFDADWFDRNPPPNDTLDSNSLQRFYAEAVLFVLEIHLDPLNRHLFGILSLIEEKGFGDYEMVEWLAITAVPSAPSPISEGELRMIVYSNLFTPGTASTVREATTVTDEERARLERIVSIEAFPDATTAEVDAALQTPGSVPVNWSIVYDVGQGAAIGLCEEHGAVLAYLDCGGGVLANAFTFPPALRRFCFSVNPRVILSHWDFDHWSSAYRDPRFLTTTWIAPRQSVGPTHIALMADIATRGKLLLLPQGFPAVWRGQLYLESCTGLGRNHSGLAVTLSEQDYGDGQRILYPGDARYSSIPSFAGNNYLSVITPHHGADMRNGLVPGCPGTPASRLVHTFGAGNRYAHPRPITRFNHHQAGWRDPQVATSLPLYQVRETADRTAAGLGHVYLGWQQQPVPPRLMCEGQCQLQAQQV